MLLLTTFLPLLNFLVTCLFGRFLGKKGAITTSVISMYAATTLSFVAFFFYVLGDNFQYITLGTWINSDFFVVNWGFIFDTLTISMFIVVNTISTLVHTYSASYMSEDPHIIRFLSYLSLFTFFMLILVSADNFIQMFLGWEGIGLCSYLLISFWFTRIQANKAAIKALLVNRVGDFGLTLGMILVFINFNSMDFATVFVRLSHFNEFNNQLCPVVLTGIGILLFIGAIGKSAQIGLHTWLPDAMEGPTPVSALIHAATLVTAGVFLIIRCSPIFEFADGALLVITVFGSLTALFAASAGLVQNDIKKVIAYSTCSQLGYMVFICGLSSYNASFFHLANHAFFKALLFLSAGSVIHGLNNEQDMRRMGALSQILPFTYVMILIGSLSLMGFPFLSGYYSKDFILELAYSNFYSHNLINLSFFVKGLFPYVLGTLAAIFTAIYSFRLIYLVFLARANMYKSSIKVSHELPLIMAFPLAILSFGSVFLGYLSKDMFIGLGTPLYNNAIYCLDEHYSLTVNSEFLCEAIKLLPVVLSLFFCFLFLFLWILLEFFPKVNRVLTFSFTKGNLRDLYTYLVYKWHFDGVYNYYITRVTLLFSFRHTFKLLDKGLIEFLGPSNIPKLIYYVVNSNPGLKSGQTGLLQYHIFYLFFGFFTFLYLLFF